jgi:peptidyl-prolyl cis-trans isomerase B (cyclophilin B)
MIIVSKCWLKSFLVLVLIASLGIGGCTSPTNSAESSKNDSTKVPTSISADSSSQKMTENLARLEGKATVVMTVNNAEITIEVDGDDAPITAGNFVDLVEKGVYDGLAFHRVVKDPQPFVAQGGDPQGKNPNVPVGSLGTGGFVDPQTGRPRYIPLEIKLKEQEEPIYSKAVGMQATGSSPAVVLNHKRGAIAMARSQMPDSASSQFYFALADLQFLDGDYAVFGYVTKGMDVVDEIKQGDRIQSAKVVSGLENLKK